MSTEMEMIEINPPEASRTYTFPGGEQVVLHTVTHILVRESGTHRLRTADGKLHIVPAGWLHIEIDAKDWTL
jgi:hypothetical protein